MKGGFNKKKLTVGVIDVDRKITESAGNVEEEEDSEPFVFEIVTEAEIAVEVRERRGGD